MEHAAAHLDVAARARQPRVADAGEQAALTAEAVVVTPRAHAADVEHLDRDRCAAAHQAAEGARVRRVDRLEQRQPVADPQGSLQVGQRGSAPSQRMKQAGHKRCAGVAITQDTATVREIDAGPASSTRQSRERMHLEAISYSLRPRRSKTRSSPLCPP